MVELWQTLLAERQAKRMRGQALKAYTIFLDDLAHRGCAALSYRITGPGPLHRLCVKHLRGRDRVVVAFQHSDHAWVLLVGEHQNSDPGRNIYDKLYQLVGTSPTSDAKRTKPPCCNAEHGDAPITDDDVVDDLVKRAHNLARNRR